MLTEEDETITRNADTTQSTIDERLTNFTDLARFVLKLVSNDLKMFNSARNAKKIFSGKWRFTAFSSQ